MMTVNEVSKLTGVSIRTLQYYDSIGLLKPAQYSESGYRLYDDTALEKMQQILLFRELEFPLKEIKSIICSSDFDKQKALDQQIELLTLKKEHLENLISFARDLKKEGAKKMDFSVFDTEKIDEYTRRAKEQWGDTKEYKEFEEKQSKLSGNDKSLVVKEFMSIFADFGEIKESDPASPKAQELVLRLKDYITKNFYTCTDEILVGLGRTYAGDNEFTHNIDEAGGEGTAKFTGKAIEIFCEK